MHGNTPDEVRHDLEGMQVMRTLGRNMAWLLKCIEIGRAAGITTPEPEPPVQISSAEDALLFNNRRPADIPEAKNDP